MTRFPDWTASEVVTATKLDQVSVDYVLKSADEDLNLSTTLQNDNHLAYTVAATGTYIADLWLYAKSAANGAGDINVGWSFPTGTLHYSAVGLGLTLASGNDGTVTPPTILNATSGVSVIGLGLSTATLLIQVHAHFVATATGTLQFMWGQNSSNANNSTVKAGSHMIVRQVA